MNRDDGNERKSKMVVTPGQPLVFIPGDDGPGQPQPSPLADKMSLAFRRYRDALDALVAGTYATVSENLPAFMRKPCDVLIAICSDGVLVRHDRAADTKSVVRCGPLEGSLEYWAPRLSEHVLHFPKDPAAFEPGDACQTAMIQATDGPSGGLREVMAMRWAIAAKSSLPPEMECAGPPARPPLLASLTNQVEITLGGHVGPAAKPELREVTAEPQRFLVHGNAELPVGWLALQVFPLTGPEAWDPAAATLWAENDILALVAQANLTTVQLNALDGRAATRKRYAALLSEFSSLLEGPEEPMHQFLKRHPQLLSPAHSKAWSKVPFGEHVSDFVFLEAGCDYELVEIEAPHRQLFRRNGHPRAEFSHALGQVRDWIQHIQDDRRNVEDKLGLVGISANPRSLVVIGRSHSLSEKEKKKLAVLQAQTNKLRIMTYDDVLARAKEWVERVLGPLTALSPNLEIYFFPAEAIESR